MTAMKLNVIELEKTEYAGGRSSLCPGCGHDQISNVIIQAAWENGIEPQGIAKMSGIGCSSKTPAYFLGNSHGFNTVHGRMPSVTTGANMVNKDLSFIAVSGDGDTASIGMGQFVHAIRRNVDMVYIIENNGVYGLTKGQYSATVEKGSKKKKGAMNEQPPIDLCAMAINLGCSFVARSFSGSKKQLTALIRAAMSHRGMAVIDIISPCVTFANNDESYRSYNYVKENDEVLHILDYIPHFSPIEEVDVPEGEYREIQLFDGSTLRLEAVGSDHDTGDVVSALRAIHEAERADRHVTGLLYYDPDVPTATDSLDLTDTPLMALPEERMRPSRESLDRVNAGFRFI
ncbi:MAG: 2-oxoacid:ferredoxin oxidoreductase subunit beta [Candidatus Thalassarchaeaceae archaeon]|jgi:2-oxoglutarate ferredoxin oxidoreductase subunit beta|nr:2-oxoacid:ferredoxin oxidoreductase subunit beta [Candidatus Thalassarchaeaceae archaeon]MDP6703417.1 2-oxoacid:ferredoxin oxidoreductase subunit beta [Candidatus Thalassarchaeaceae archaeon]MDP7004416.1 2-oxoacid:ferredoxin oxidoreductase subunit beta [Candidatus Thalassarchaeaceae archaeon]